MDEPLSPAGAVGASAAGVFADQGTCVLSPRRSARAGTHGSTAPFVAATEWLESGAPVVSVFGELDIATAPAFEDTLLGLPDEGPGPVIVDLAGCSFIDLRGLHVLLAAREHLERSGRPLSLVVGKPSLLRVFKITRVDELFAIYPSRTAAVEGGNGARPGNAGER